MKRFITTVTFSERGMQLLHRLSGELNPHRITGDTVLRRQRGRRRLIRLQNLHRKVSYAAKYPDQKLLFRVPPLPSKRGHRPEKRALKHSFQEINAPKSPAGRVPERLRVGFSRHCLRRIGRHAPCVGQRSQAKHSPPPTWPTSGAMPLARLFVLEARPWLLLFSQT